MTEEKEGTMLCKYSHKRVLVKDFGTNGCNHCVSIYASIALEDVKRAITRLNDFYQSIDPLVKAVVKLEHALDSYSWAKEKAPKPPCHIWLIDGDPVEG